MTTTKMRSLIGLLGFGLFASAVTAQDVHFSQFSQTPMQLNPALTGAFMGNHRVILNYKDQWSAIGPTTPYKTYAMGYDWTMFKKKWNNAYLGAGVFLYSDKAGTSKLGTTQANFSLSSILTVHDNHRLTVGLQGGFAQRSIDLNNPDLRWDNQFQNNSYNAALGSDEPAYQESFLYNDFSTGLSWHFGTDESNIISNDGIRMNAGFAFHHANRPSVEVLADALDKMYSRWVGHYSAHIGLLNTVLGLRPQVVYYRQGPAQEINAGMMLRYRLKEESRYTGFIKEMAISGGAFYRVGDAVIPTLEFEYANIGIGVSYDVNTSGLKAATSGRGGMELSLRYIHPNPFKYGKGSNTNARFM